MANGILEADDQGRLRPLAPATRGEAATALYALLASLMM
jgi:hypothetical protein